MTASTDIIRYAYDLLYLIRDHLGDIPVVIGGLHASARPAEVVAHGFDVAVIGPAECRVSRIVEAASSRNWTMLEQIGGVAFRDQNSGVRVVSLTDQENGLNMDDLLPVDFSSFSHEHYYKGPNDIWRFGIMLVGRGCPGQCTYCSQFQFGRKVRVSSVNKIIEDMVSRKKRYGVTEFAFWDDTIFWNKTFVTSLCEGIIACPELKGTTWVCNGRANVESPELLGLMKKSGCRGVVLGVENANPETLKKIKKGLTLEMMVRGIDAFVLAGIPIKVNLMNGFPWDTAETIKVNHEFAKALVKKGVAFTAGDTVYAYPGTELYEEVSSKGYTICNWWLRDSFYHSTYKKERRGKVPYYTTLVPQFEKVPRNDFYGVYKNLQTWNAINNLLKFSYSQILKRAPFRSLGPFVIIVVVLGKLLFKISPVFEERFWKGTLILALSVKKIFRDK